MTKLPAFGITAMALQILTSSDKLPTEINPIWFNWTNGNISRLTLVTAETAGKWSQDVSAAGYECAFICAANEEPSIDEIKGLPDDLYYSLVYSHEDDRERNDELLGELRELDTSLGLHWENLLQGGGIDRNVGFYRGDAATMVELWPSSIRLDTSDQR